MALPFARRLFTAEEYHRIAEAGVLTEDDRVELIEGEILEMSPIGSRHAACVGRLTRVFSRTVGDSAMVWVQNPIRLGERSEPEPDVALVRPRADDYAAGLPTAEDIFLLVEVADSSVDYDRQMKVPLYARTGIPEVWLANLGQQHVAVYRDPTPAGYQTVRVVRPGEAIRPIAFPDLEVAVDDILV